MKMTTGAYSTNLTTNSTTTTTTTAILGLFNWHTYLGLLHITLG